MSRKTVSFVACVMLTVMIAGCGGSSTKVARVDSDSVIDLSGRWNDTDSRLVADEMVKDALNQRWIHNYEGRGQVPTVLIGRVTNRSHEHVSVETFIKDIERALLNSGRVEFVAGGNQRAQIRDEREEQQIHAAAHTRAEFGEEQGADLMMVGTLNAIVDQEGRRSVITYQIDMELIEMESSRKVWMGNKVIKKYIERAGARL